MKFPFIAQAYKIKRETFNKRSGETSLEASPKDILHKVRGHWSVEACHYIIDFYPSPLGVRFFLMEVVYSFNRHAYDKTTLH
ncbi:MAG: hypothetical protein GY786_07455 [Proteobacteria bacterium]|nr:hypothetical protein [Pseudomonadota bacterium]